MGIKNLRSIIPPECVKERQVEDFFGYWIAIDASMFLYQSLVAIRQGSDVLADANGNPTSHLQGLFWRSIRFLERGIKPVYVFDGKPPEMKAGELKKRKERKQAAEQRVVESKEVGDAEEEVKAAKQTVRLSQQNQDEAKHLLRLMGIPVVEAKGEAEAQCVQMCKDGLVAAVATEDMDALTFGCPKLVRRFMAPEKKKIAVHEYRVSDLLAAMDLTMDQFVDVCIMCGCDYTETIPGIGPKKALDGIKEHKSIEAVLTHLSAKQQEAYNPDNFRYEEARRLFKQPEVTPSDELKSVLAISKPKKEELLKFLVDEKMFNPERVESGLKRIVASKGKAGQTRLDSFFKVSQTPVKKTPSRTPAKKGAKPTPKRAGTKKPSAKRSVK
ncbi:Flap endonuclease, FEN1 [Carpediemonas membranifera]|uniref:Flap endonuclease 1 n=1 Tax=Carpediemonas membranifera TaxID=201153 RepID=A0A8J6AZJ9_9EUKA|nr:Flap endonuclease, FEN1 [Carpediemonas membranifera]|eukprot:KAG9391069.1 Flap endonuclease, FEN1 [Carpediemonas membranifera]